MGNAYEASFKLMTTQADITGDTAGREPGNFQFMTAKTREGSVEITNQEVAYLYVDIDYSIGSTSYSRLSWKVVGPAIVATPQGITYSVAEYIQFGQLPEEIRGMLYIKSILS